MDSNGWSELREPWERLGWARRYWQTQTGVTPTMRAAAESLGMKEGTYSTYERAPDTSKHTPLDHHRAIQFGRKFKINWVWILTGEGTPFSRTPAEVRAAELLAQADEEEAKRALEVLETMLRRRSA